MLGSFAVGNVQPLTHAVQQKQPRSSLASLFTKRASAGKRGQSGVATCSSPITTELEPITCSAPVIPQCEAFETDTPHSDLFFYSPRTAPAPPPSPPVMPNLVSQAIRAMKEWDADLAEDSFWADV